MGKSIGEITKIRKPRAPQKGEPILVRLQPALLAKIDAIRADKSRPEAIRQILEKAMPKEDAN